MKVPPGSKTDGLSLAHRTTCERAALLVSSADKALFDQEAWWRLAHTAGPVAHSA